VPPQEAAVFYRGLPPQGGGDVMCLRWRPRRFIAVSPLKGEWTKDYFRITFSEGVSASKNAGRENRRSAYFISGAAGLPSAMS
jgi:hypothetical protein